MTLHSLELMSLPGENPILMELHMGEFPAYATANSFLPLRIDMALEQTINAKAKTLLKGIMVYADVAFAVSRWLIINSTLNQ